MPTLLKSKSIWFNDVVLIQQLGKVESRKDVPNELYRIITSPMVSLAGEKFFTQAARLGLSVTIPRFLNNNEKIDLLNLFKKNRISNSQLCFLGIGPNESYVNLAYLKHYFTDVLVDFANGAIPQLYECLDKITRESFIKSLMVGNITTKEGLNYVYETCKNFTCNLFVRVGVGNGNPCSSSDETGFNRGQITELFDCYEYKRIKNDKKLFLVSDGGIYKPGFAVKAFGAGADYCLMGGYFIKALEAETHISGDGTYFGCASEKQNKLAGLNKHSEGKERKINTEELVTLENLVNQLWGGISSGISYSGYTSVTDFIGNGVFEEKCNSLPPKNRH